MESNVEENKEEMVEIPVKIEPKNFIKCANCGRSVGQLRKVINDGEKKYIHKNCDEDVKAFYTNQARKIRLSNELL